VSRPALPLDAGPSHAVADLVTARAHPRPSPRSAPAAHVAAVQRGSWRHASGDRGTHVGVEPFGASVDQDRRLAVHGLTVDDLVATIRQLVSRPEPTT
jgi:transketolase